MKTEAAGGIIAVTEEQKISWTFARRAGYRLLAAAKIDAYRKPDRKMPKNEAETLETMSGLTENT